MCHTFEKVLIQKIKNKITELEVINQSGDFDEHIEMLEELIEE